MAATGILAITGCAPVLHGAAGGTHTIAITVSSPLDATSLTYGLNGHSRQVLNHGVDSKRAAVVVSAANGDRLTVFGGPPGWPQWQRPMLTKTNPQTGVTSFVPAALAAANEITCTVSVDGTVRMTRTVHGPRSATAPPAICRFSAYIAARPSGPKTWLECAAFGICLLIVVVAISALVRTRQA